MAKSKFWFMEPVAFKLYRDFKNQLTNVSESQFESFLNERKKLESGELTVADGTAIIPIRGTLSNRASFFSFLYNGSLNTYPSIIKQFNAAEVNPSVEKIRMLVDSPGGAADGLFNLLYIIQGMSKPVEAIVETRADSAAFGIVAQADKIIAANDMSEIGSIGVGTSFYVSNSFVDITSSDAPQKWPDVKTEEGVEIVRAELDEIHEKFAGIIAEGRAAATGKTVTIDTVNKKFGQGGTMLAEAGLAAGMIDEIQSAPDRISNAGFFKNSDSSSPGFQSGTKTETESFMDIRELKTKHPEVYEAAVKAGQETERERVSALLKLGASCGKMDFAVECVENGKCMTQPTVQAEFLTAKKNKKDVEDREGDDPEKVETPESDADKEDEAEVVKRFLARRKKEA